ncbi:MAG TPA: hypothetical protein VMF30_01140 [Pirellulales bacterium]|nr:hypothetical protein [Pirellulales bacterium]
MNLPDESDPLHELLGGRGGTQQEEAARAALAARVMAETLPVLRRRRIARRCGLATALVGCYVAGALSMNLWHAERSRMPQVALGPAAVEQTREAGPAPVVAETRAALPQTPFEKLRDAGDRAWQERDIEAAIRLYAEAVRVATPAERRFSAADDNFLLITLKEDQNKEPENGQHEHGDDQTQSPLDKS